MNTLIPSRSRAWRPMRPDDLTAVVAIADVVHADHPEDAEVFIEHQALWPRGNLALQAADAIDGYMLAHPWRLDLPVALNGRLGPLPAEPDTFHLHDLCLLPQARGAGAAQEALSRCEAMARELRLPTVSLVALPKAVGFWSKQGFKGLTGPELNAKLETYAVGTAFMTKAIPTRATP